MERESVRAETLRQRDGLAPETRAVFSRQIVDTVMHWIQYEGLDAVMLYLNMRSEVETDGLLEGLLHAGKRVAAPVMNTERNCLIPRRIQSGETNLVRHRYGMLEPSTTCPIFPVEQLQLIVVPGIAFDRRGYRLGYGKGFYDRFLANCPHAIPIGLAYQIQVVKDTFPETWDVPVQHVFTETGRIDVSLLGSNERS